MRTARFLPLVAAALGFVWLLGGAAGAPPRWQVIDGQARRWVGLDENLVPLLSAPLPAGVTRLASRGAAGAWAWGRPPGGAADLLLGLSPLGRVERVEALGQILDVASLGSGEALVLWERAPGGSLPRLDRVPRRGPRRPWTRVSEGWRVVAGEASALVASERGRLALFPLEDTTWLEAEAQVGPLAGLRAGPNGGFLAWTRGPRSQLLALDGRLRVTHGTALGGGGTSFVPLERGVVVVGRPIPGALEARRPGGGEDRLGLGARGGGALLAASRGQVLAASATALFAASDRGGRLELLSSQGGWGRLEALAPWDPPRRLAQSRRAAGRSPPSRP